MNLINGYRASSINLAQHVQRVVVPMLGISARTFTPPTSMTAHEGCREALGESLAFGRCRHPWRTDVVIGGIVEELHSHLRGVLMATSGIITGGGHMR
jgi:hypothetical protein